jgi:CRP-like cAMP-binding protein
VLQDLTEACTKDSFFDGQHVMTQGEEDDDFFIIRRGRVEFLMDEQLVKENVAAGQGCESLRSFSG